MTRLEKKLRDLILSIYLHNEWQGFVQLEQELIPELERHPQESALLDRVRSHARDERRHYGMFKAWFLAQGRMPFEVDSRVYHFENLMGRLFSLPSRGTAHRVSDPQGFAQLCRTILLTERRGLRQLDKLLRWRAVREDPRLVRILLTIRRDEPNHFLPYEGWLTERGLRGPGWRERLADAWVHGTIALWAVPALLFRPRLPRRTDFPI